MLSNINKHFKNLYPNNPDLINISLLDSFIKIAGFKHKEVQKSLWKILIELVSHNIPKHWENVISLLDDEKNFCKVYAVHQGSEEWYNVEKKFKLTMPDAKVQALQRI